MARARRRSAKSNADPSVDEEPLDTAAETQTDGAGAANGNTGRKGGQDDDKCPACRPDEAPEDTIAQDQESWVRCDACKRWFHWRCAGDGGDLDALDKWSEPLARLSHT